MERVTELARQLTWLSPYGPLQPRTVVGATYLQVTVRDAFDPTGVVTSSYTPRQQADADSLETLKQMIGWGLPMHTSLMADSFGFHGGTLVAMRNSWNRNVGGNRVAECGVWAS